jgi:hypothetical protein
MKKALLITIGTGVGSNKTEILQSLSDGITYCITNCNPTKTVFIVSADSERDTLPLILEKSALSPEEYDTKFLSSIDEIEIIYDECVTFIKELLKEGFNEKDIVVDFTSGTKAMSAGLAVAATTMDIENFSYISGKREGGKVAKGTEKILSRRIYKIISDNKLKIVRSLFNNYQFDACLDILEDLKKKFGDKEFQEMLKEYENVCYAFSAWDRFNHNEAKKKLLATCKLDLNLSDNIDFLNGLVTSQDKIYAVVDLLTNAERRGEEGKYDDAVARLYRTIELIAQYRLESKHNVKCGIVDLNKTPVISREWLLEKRDSEGIIKLSMHHDYRLLKDFNDELGMHFSGDDKLQSYLGVRNSSILAHGLTPVKRNHYNNLLEKVIEFAIIDSPNIVELKEKAKFSKFAV